VDVLSDVIAVMRTGEPRSARVEWHAPWGQRFVSIKGSAGFQVVMQGSCWLVPPGGPPIALADNPDTPLTDPACDPQHDPRWDQRYASDVIGRTTDSQAVTVTVCGGYQLDTTRAHPLLRELPEIVHLPAKAGQRLDLRAAVDLLGGELGDIRLGVDTVVPALLDMLLLYILRAWFTEQGEHGRASGWVAALSDPAVSAALSAIHGDPGKPWSVEALATRARLSRAAFSRKFTTLVGQPPMTYLTWWRMTSAARLLRDSEASLSVIAGQVGYTSEYAFSNAFKRQFGTAPGRYRRS
jgi:AraC-like DNA-binding protein